MKPQTNKSLVLSDWTSVDTCPLVYSFLFTTLKKINLKMWEKGEKCWFQAFSPRPTLFELFPKQIQLLSHFLFLPLNAYNLNLSKVLLSYEELYRAFQSGLGCSVSEIFMLSQVIDNKKNS